MVAEIRVSWFLLFLNTLGCAVYAYEVRLFFATPTASDRSAFADKWRRDAIVLVYGAGTLLVCKRVRQGVRALHPHQSILE